MYSLVLDPSSLILYCEKSEEDKEAIQFLGNSLPGVDCITVCLSRYLVKTYETSTVSLLKGYHPLPRFQVGLIRISRYLREISIVSRKSLCKVIPLELVKLHILRTSRVDRYNVDNLGLKKKDDKEVLKVALASAHKRTFLVAIDRHFLEDLNLVELSKRYPKESQNLKIVKPNDPELTTILVTHTL